jgi:16S rRNA processing protein RimM
MPRPPSRTLPGAVSGGTPDPAGTDARGATEQLRIGRVARAHGLKGELEVRLDWPDSRALLEAERVQLSRPDAGSESYVIASTRSTGKGILLRLEGVADRDAAEALCGSTVSVWRAELPPLEEGEYYLCDLVGLAVSGPSGPLGRVLETQMYPSVDAIVIEAPDGARYEQPLLAEWLERVDVSGEGIVLRSLDGLLEVASAARADADTPRQLEEPARTPSPKAGR